MVLTFLKTAIKTSSKWIARNSPWILMGLGTGGVVSTVIFAVKATPKAMELIKKEEKETGEELSKIDILKTTWKAYLPTALLGLASIGCFFGANSIHLKRTAALASAYTMAEKALTEYQKKVVETIGEKEEKAIRKKIADDRVAEQADDIRAFKPSSKEMFPCLCTMTGQIFAGNRQTLELAELRMKELVRTQMYASKTEWEQLTGMRQTFDGDEMFWTEENGFDISVETGECDGSLCYVVNYLIPPKRKANMYS